MESCHGVFGRLAKTMINEDFRPTKKPIKRGGRVLDCGT